VTKVAKVARVQCRACGASLGAAQVLAACTVSWPNQKWLLFECPSCHGDAHVQVSNGRLAIGVLDGAPGPCFLADQTVALAGLKVTANAGGITVVLDGKRTRVPAKA
jgi:hypothetical protein